MRIISPFLVTFLLLGNALSLRGLDFTSPTDLTSPTSTPSTIDINNRVLLKVNGKSLSVFDVVKKLDILFYKQLPEHISSPVIRYQFYVTNWRTVFDSLVDEALIGAGRLRRLTDASDIELVKHTSEREVMRRDPGLLVDLMLEAAR